MTESETRPKEAIRAFLAITPPNGFPLDAGRLPEALSSKLRGSHLTLFFLGELDLEAIERVKAQCGLIRLPSFKLRIRGLGSFGRRAGGVLWAGLDPSEGLSALKHAVDQAVTRALGIEPQGAFKPHLTIKRLRGGGEPARQLIEDQRGRLLGEFDVKKFTLYRSELRPGGPIHAPWADGPLGPPSRGG
jgi:2'-5' RNA ligase